MSSQRRARWETVALWKGKSPSAPRNQVASVPPQLRELQSAYEGARRTAHQLKRKCHRLTCDLEDTRLLLENQQGRNHELEKKQKK